MSRARGIFRLNLQRCGAYIIDGERLNSRSIYRSAQLYSMLFLPQTPLLGGASPRCGNRRSHPPLNTNPKPPASGLKGGTDVTKWMTFFCLRQKKTSERSEIRSDVVAGRGFEPTDLRVMSPTSYRTAPPRDICSLVSLIIIAHWSRRVKSFFSR